MNIVQRSALTALLALAGCGLASPLLADELALEPTPQVTGAAPGRGTHMDTVLRRFGEPSQRLAAVGGNLPQHPPITRWIYPDYTVYFERELVIASIPNRVVAQPADKP
jgi:hypothetical protein